MKAFDSFLFVGRFQTFTVGHMSLIETALRVCDRGLVIVGSAQEQGTERNPFDVGLRMQVIRECVDPEKVSLLALADMTTENDITPDWGRYLIAHTERAMLKMPEVMIYGNDESRSRWFDPADIAWTEMIINRNNIPVSGTQMRQWMLEDNYREWFKWAPEKAHKFYPEMRARLLAVPYYTDLNNTRMHDAAFTAYWVSKAGMKLNPDKAVVEKIRAALVKTKGQCPCVPPRLWDDDTKCMPCLEARMSGNCHCGLYVRKED